MKTKVEHATDDGKAGAPTFSIETPEDHHVARERIKALEGGTRDESAEQELEALKQAVTRWNRRRAAL